MVKDLADRNSDKDLRMHVFSLSDYRDAVGGKWTRLSGLIDVAVEAIARRNINLGNDIFTQLDSELSCLAIPNTPRQEVRTCVAAIARDISEHLFGDATINGRRPQVIVTNLPLTEVISEDGVLQSQSIHAAVAEAGAALLPDMGLGVGADAAKLPHRATLEALMQDGPVVAPLPLAPISAVSWNLAPTAADDPNWFEAVINERSAAAERQQTSAMTGTSKLTLLWTPTWVTAQKGLGAFHARVVRTDSDHGPALEGVHAYADASPVETLTLDRFVATGAALDLKKLYFGRQHIGLTVPVHWMSLAPKWRDCIRIPFDECPQKARRKFLKIEVFGLSSAIPRRVFEHLFDPLESLGCDVMARLSLADTDLIGLLPTVKAVGFDLAELAEADRVGDDELFERIQGFREAARAHRLACYAWGGRRRALIARMIGAGFSLVNGPGVMCDLSHPVLPTVARRVA